MYLFAVLHGPFCPMIKQFPMTEIRLTVMMSIHIHHHIFPFMHSQLNSTATMRPHPAKH